MKIAIGSDHAGFNLKGIVSRHLAGQGHELKDVGTFSEDSCDYPEFAYQVGRELKEGGFDRGILICATGNGMAIAVNKLKGIRAAVCNDLYTARYSRLHNDANVLCIGARVVGEGLALEIVKTWMETGFEGGRHERRTALIASIEDGERGV